MRRDDELANHGICLQAVFMELIEATGKTRYQIANETGISQTTLSRYVSG